MGTLGSGQTGSRENALSVRHSLGRPNQSIPAEPTNPNDLDAADRVKKRARRNTMIARAERMESKNLIGTNRPAQR
jgi:hypothetical protein